MNEQRNGTPPTDSILAKPNHTRRWLIVAACLSVLVALSIGGAFLAAHFLAKPAVESIDEIDVANIDKMAVLALNRPDGGPDITAGGKEPLSVPKEYYTTILTPLRGATPIDKNRGIYFGQLQIQFKDGRKVTVMLHRVYEDGVPGAVPILQFKIGQKQFEVKPLDKFLTPLSSVESKIKGG